MLNYGTECSGISVPYRNDVCVATVTPCCTQCMPPDGGIPKHIFEAVTALKSGRDERRIALTHPHGKGLVHVRLHRAAEVSAKVLQRRSSACGCHGEDAREALRDQNCLPAEIHRYRVHAEGVAPVERVGEHLVQPFVHARGWIERDVDLHQAPPHDEIRDRVAAAQLGSEDYPAAVSAGRTSTASMRLKLCASKPKAEGP